MLNSAFMTRKILLLRKWGREMSTGPKVTCNTASTAFSPTQILGEHAQLHCL